MKASIFCRRLTALLTALVLLCGTLSACGEEEKADQITLRTISVMGGDGIKEAYTALLESYSAQYPHVYHIGTVADSSNAYKLDALFEDTYTASRYPHAVYYYTNTGLDALREHFVSVEEIRQSYPDFASDVTEAALDSARSDDGSVYCVPFAGRWTALAVNRSLLNRYDLQMPDTWQQLVSVCSILSERGVTPIANPPEGSAALLELMCLNGGAEHALQSAIRSSSPLPLEKDRKLLTEVFRCYGELCAAGAFPQPIAADELQRAVELAVSGSDAVSGTDLLFGTVHKDPVDMFNAGEAAMVVVDSSQYARITLGNFELMQFPACGSGSEEGYVMAGGFDTGWYITRRAFNDNTVRDAVVAFVDAMTGSRAAAEFSALGYLPSAQVSEVSFTDAAGLLDLAGSGDEFSFSLINSVNSSRFSRLELIASAICMGLITPEQGTGLAADPGLKLTDLLARPAAPQQPVSGSDAAPVSAE